MEAIKPELVVLGQALIAIALGGLVGWEREIAGKWAGIRTHMLVCLAALLFTRVAEFMAVRTGQAISHEFLRTDPMRILEAIVTGVAFIGAGTVFRDRGNVAHGLTTAASLLAVAPIGVAVAVSKYVFATGATALIFLVLRGVNWLEFRARLKQPRPEGEFGPPPRPPRPNPQFRNDRRGRPGNR